MLLLKWRGCSRISHHFLHSDVRVRFAPSPTGELHLGSLRTALYNLLFARSRGGSFIVRIEDTDQARLVPGSSDRVRDTLNYYSLHSDENPWIGGPLGPYFQSERLSIYRDNIEHLVESRQAYRCFCSSERLDLLRKDAVRSGRIPMYDRKCLGIDKETAKKRADDGEDHVIRFKMDIQDVHFKDVVFGDVTQRLDESDPVLLKSDGFPTYHLANVVDDHRMRISHVIRGMEWLSSTGKHLLLYKAFGWTPPSFVHLPLITRDGKKKLSKRDKGAFAGYYDRDLGILPQAVINLLVRNGSGIKHFDSNHLYSLHELIDNFDVDMIGRRNLMLDSEVLDKYASMAFRSASFEDILYPLIYKRVESEMPSALATVQNQDYVRRVVDFLRQKEETFGAISDLTRGRFAFLFAVPQNSQKILSLFPVETVSSVLNEVLSSDHSWSIDHLKTISASLDLPYPKVLSVLRLALIDNTSGPPIMELYDFFGKDECINRLSNMLKLIKS